MVKNVLNTAWEAVPLKVNKIEDIFDCSGRHDSINLSKSDKECGYRRFEIFLERLIFNHQTIAKD